MFDGKFFDTDGKTELKPTVENLAGATFRKINDNWLKQIYTGKCGDNATFEFQPTTGELTISGSGSMYDYTENSMPWDSYKESIKSVKIVSSITYIGKFAFNGCNALESISLSDSITGIGDSAFDGKFYDSDGKTELAQTAANLAGSTFKNIGGKWIKQVPSPSDDSDDSGSKLIYTIVATIAVIALLAGILIVRSKNSR